MLSPKIKAHMLQRYSGTGLTPAALESMWIAATSWVEENVASKHMVDGFTPALEVAAMFRIHAICAHKDQALKAAYMFCAVESLAPYKN